MENTIITPIEVFKAKEEMGLKSYCEIRKIIKKQHLEFGTHRDCKTICAVSSVENIYKKYGHRILNEVLSYCKKTNVSLLTGSKLEAIAIVIATYSKTVKDKAIFIESIRSVCNRKESAPAIIYAEAIVKEYNHRIGLPVTILWREKYE